jgi:epoxyqueuosine reductase QueG
MTDTPSSGASYTGISRFFSERGMDAFVIAPVSVIGAPAGRHPRDLLPSCRTIVIFGRVMPDAFFFGTDLEKKSATRDLMNALKSTAAGLNALLESEGHPAVPVFPFLPLEAGQGQIRGKLSMKHCARDAGFGTIGENTLLVHPVYGNRLALAAVITEKEMEPTPPLTDLPACTRCNRCVNACPTGAIHNGVVDLTSCRNLTDYAPGPLLSLTKYALSGGVSARIMTALVNRLGAMAEIEAGCTACVTSCPYFHKGKR